MKREEESKLISFFQQKSFQNIFFFSLNFGSSLRRCTIGQSRNINFWRFSRRLHLTYLLKAKQYLEKFSSSWQANVFLKSANVVFFQKMGHPRSLLCLFSVFFKQTSFNFYNKLIWKNVHPVYGTGIRTHNRESPPITTRPGLRPLANFFCCNFEWIHGSKIFVGTEWLWLSWQNGRFQY